MSARTAAAQFLGRLRASVEHFRERLFDWQHGVETRGRVPPEELVGIAPDARKEASAYAPTPLALMRRIIRKSRVEPSAFTFIDIGCGKGRTLLIAAEYGFKAVVGVEADGGLCDAARKNLQSSAAQIVHTDARDFELPSGPLFLYFYDPFGGAVLDEVVRRVAAAAAEPDRAIVVAYNADPRAEVLERTGLFRRLRMRPLQFWKPPAMSFFFNSAAEQLRR